MRFILSGTAATARATKPGTRLKVPGKHDGSGFPQLRDVRGTVSALFVSKTGSFSILLSLPNNIGTGFSNFWNMEFPGTVPFCFYR